MKPSPRASRYFRGGDIGETFLHGLGALSVRVLPPSHWPAVGDFFARLSSNNSGSRGERFRRSVRAVLGDQYEEMAAEIYRGTEVHAERRRLYIAALSAGVKWSPSIELIGLEEVLRSRQRAIILWFDYFVHFSVLGKMGLAIAGHPFWQLSTHSHGFSGTAYGVRFLNPRQVNVERRYLQGRIAFDNRSLVSATREVVKILDDGGMVGITNNAHLGRAVDIPFGNKARLSVATTPLKLALRRDVAVFPVNVLETDPFNSYRVTIGPALTVREFADPMSEMLAEYSDYLLPLIRAHPDQWAGWRSIIVD